MKGYRTVVVMTMGLIYALLASFGFVVPQDDQAALSTGIVALVGLVLRFYTNTEIGEAE